jgi:hypothetical protein
MEDERMKVDEAADESGASALLEELREWWVGYLCTVGLCSAASPLRRLDWSPPILLQMKVIAWRSSISANIKPNLRLYAFYTVSFVDYRQQ